MPKDIIIIIIIIINIIIIIKALTGTQGLQAKAGIAAEGTDSPVLWEQPGWNHCSQSSAKLLSCPWGGDPAVAPLCLPRTLPWSLGMAGPGCESTPGSRQGSFPSMQSALGPAMPQGQPVSSTTLAPILGKLRL